MSTDTHLGLYGIIWGAGADILSRSGAIAAEANTTGKPVDEYHLERLETEARRILNAVAEYRDRDTIAATEADPVITWPRASCDRKDTGLRYGDGLKRVPLPTLMDMDDDARLSAWGTLVREMNGDDGEAA